MQLKLKRPLVFFDLETTGTRITHDRIVEMAFIKLMPQGDKQEWYKRLNPGIPIPTESSLVHGIYDEDVKDAPLFKTIAKELIKFLQGCDLSGFNVLRFDIPMLMESFIRADVDFNLSNRHIVDTQRIFHLMEKRNLATAYQFYCQQELVEAHSAMADTKAALEVLQAQVMRYENQPVTDNAGQALGNIENDIEHLGKITVGTMIDLAGRMVMNKHNVAIFNFGKHKGKVVTEVLQKEPSYYEWIMQGDFPLDTKRKLTQLRLQIK
ncbi:MAG: exonuclease domain-containing protein [Bacteroidota bacterium]